jgi:undecaprenyl-diphosphatase
VLGRGDSVGVSRQEAQCLVVATLPALVVGLVFSDFIDGYLRGTAVIATTTLVFGLLLGLSYRYRYRYRLAGDGEQPITRVDHAVMIGLAQALALIPGTSRSGITITASLFLGYNVATAARFSFLLSIPVIFGALILMMIRQTDAFLSASNLGLMALAMVISAISAYLTIAFFVGLVVRVGMMPFVVYRVALALGLFSIVVFL